MSAELDIQPDPTLGAVGFPRLVSEARQQLAALAPGLNPEMYRRLDNEVRDAERQAQQRANDYVAQHVTPVIELGQQTIRDACELRDQAVALAADVRSGRMSGSDANARLVELRNAYRQITVAGERITRTVNTVEPIEADPIAWADHFARRFPHTKRRFTF